MSCPLCTGDGGELMYRDNRLRVILADEPGYPGFTRVVWHAHRAEMTDLEPDERQHLMDTVWRVEAVMRDVMQPDKINLASLGNQVPHLHWHIIPRFTDDPAFPAPVWAPPVRQADAARLADRLAAFRTRLAALGNC